MKTTDFVRMSMENSAGWCLGLLQDMKDSPLQQPTANGGNHPLWVLGHITYAESILLDQCIHGQPNRFASWETLFGPGSQPSSNADDYPSFDELEAKFTEVRAASFEHLATLSEADLDGKSNAPEEFGPLFATTGAVFAAMSNHVAFHSGQVADARRAAGKGPLMM